MDLLDVRNFVENALADAGAQTGDAGMGMGGADIWFWIDGHEYHIELTPTGLSDTDSRSN